MARTYVKAAAERLTTRDFPEIFCCQDWNFSFPSLPFHLTFSDHVQKHDRTEIISTTHRADLLGTAHSFSRQTLGGCMWSPGKELTKHSHCTSCIQLPSPVGKKISKRSPEAHLLLAPTSQLWKLLLECCAAHWEVHSFIRIGHERAVEIARKYLRGRECASEWDTWKAFYRRTEQKNCSGL